MMCKQSDRNRNFGAWMNPRALLAAAAIFAGVGAGTGSAMAFNPPVDQPSATADETQDTLVFLNGKVLKGTILSETATTIRFKGLVSGIPFEADYEKKDISTITRATKKPAGGAPSGATPAAVPTTGAPVATPAAATPTDAKAAVDDSLPKYYWIDLKGEFGRDISETPIRNAVREAQVNKADYIIVSIKADWKPQYGEAYADFGDNLSEVFRAEPMAKVFAEIANEWDEQPTTVFWVKDAMAGAAFLPFISPNIYFHSEGRLGGLGGLSFLFRGVGDDFVQEKQKSLRMGHAEGVLRLGGYDDRLVRAMSRYEAVYTLTYENGVPKMVDRMPENPGEELLTDDGEGANADRMEDRVRGIGNDVLTLDARLAKLLGVSKGTVDSKDELLTELGLARGATEISGKSEKIFKDWSTGLDNAQRQLRRLVNDYREIEVEGEWTERTAARGKQKRTLLEIKGVLNRWGEALSDRWLGQNGIPGIGQLDTLIEQIGIEQKLDKK